MPFRCDVCGKDDFKSETGMKGHKTKMHSNNKGFPPPGVKPEGNFTFDVCGKNGFKSEASMKCHKTKIHSNDKGFPPPGVKPGGKFTFEECRKNGFKSEASMKCHTTKIHSNDKGFPPPGVKPEGKFTFEECRKNGFKSEASMKCHKTKKHSNDKGFLAQGVKPESEASMKGHKTRVHGKETKVSSPTPRLNNPGGYLSQRMEGARLRINDINKAADTVRDFIEGDRGVRKKLNDNGGGFIWDILTSGSYYDKTKNISPDEFDFMISPMNLDCYMKWDKDMPKGFCKIGLKGTDRNELMTGGYLDPVKFKDMAFKLFGDAAKRRNVKRKKKDMDSPAYTILYNPGAGLPDIDIDLVPSIEIKAWPKPRCFRQVAPTWVENDDFWKKCKERYHVVAKSCPETDYPEDERKLLWRMSFSAAEKHLILHANRGNDRSIRKPVFRFLKTLLEETKSGNEGKIKKLCSYHLKMFMLHQFDSWPNDSDDAIHKRDSCIHILQQLNTILEQNPTKGFPRIENYFLKGDNIIRHVPKHETELFRNTMQSELVKLS